MIKLNKSHSKGDLVEIFKSLGVAIDKKLTKSIIVNNICDYIEKAQYNDKIKNVGELIDLLKSDSEKQRPNLKLKNEIMTKSKKIIKYCSDNYELNDYETHEDVFADIMSIYKFGDLASVRKACSRYNESPHAINHINPIISSEKMIELNKKKLMKQTKINCLISKTDTFTITFT